MSEGVLKTNSTIFEIMLNNNIKTIETDISSCCTVLTKPLNHGENTAGGFFMTIDERKESENGRLLEHYARENAAGDSRQYLPESLSEDAPLLLEKDDQEIALPMTEETLADNGLEGEEIRVEEESIQTPYEGEEKKGQT